jgi:hypothetical protein
MAYELLEKSKLIKKDGTILWTMIFFDYKSGEIKKKENLQLPRLQENESTNLRKEFIDE